MNFDDVTKYLAELKAELPSKPKSRPKKKSDKYIVVHNGKWIMATKDIFLVDRYTSDHKVYGHDTKRVVVTKGGNELMFSRYGYVIDPDVKYRRG